MMFEGGMGRKLSTLFGKTPEERATALVFQLPGEKARGKLAEMRADAMPALLTMLRGAQAVNAGVNQEALAQMRAAAAEVVVKIGAPALASLRPLLASGNMDEKRLGYSLIRKILIRTLEKQDADAAQKEAAGAEVLGMLGSANGAEVRLAVEYAAYVGGAEAVGALGTLAKDGWSEAQRKTCSARIAEMEEIRSLLASKVDISRRSNKGAVPEGDLLKVMLPGDNVAVADALATNYRLENSIERHSTRAEAVKALGKIGSADAVGALIGLLDAVEYNPDVMTMGGLDCRIADELRGAVARGPELMSLLIEAAKKWNATERAEKEKVGVVSDSPERRKAAHISELLSGVL